MKHSKSLLTCLLALGLGGCGGGGGGGTSTPPAKPAEITASTATWVTHGSFHYQCPDVGPCKVGFPARVAVTEAGATLDVEFYNAVSQVLLRKDSFTASGSEQTFTVEPIEVPSGGGINVRLVSSSPNGRIDAPSFQSYTAGQLITPKIDRVPPAEVVDDDVFKGAAKSQLKCPADGDPCKLASFMLGLTNVVPGTTTYVRAYTAGTDLLLEERAIVTAGTTSSEKVTFNVATPAGTVMEYRVTSSASANIRISYRIVYVGDKMLRPTFKTDPSL